jgi:predicted DsbA family dithiol-disulfide isomerase
VSQVLKVDVWSDIACPWCYVGKRRFEEGVRRFRDSGGDRPIEVEYHSFELAPDTPVDFQGSEIDFLADFKGMPVAQVRQMLDHMVEVAASVGLEFDYDALQHTNTLKAHQLLHLAKGRGKQQEMKERLLRAYFVEGRHVGHDADLTDLAAEVGLDRGTVRAALRDGAFRDAVEADIRQARAYGITGVPFFVIDHRYGVSGAQDPDLFAQALRQERPRRGSVHERAAGQGTSPADGGRMEPTPWRRLRLTREGAVVSGRPRRAYPVE